MSDRTVLTTVLFSVAGLECIATPKGKKSKFYINFLLTWDFGNIFFEKQDKKLSDSNLPQSGYSLTKIARRLQTEIVQSLKNLKQKSCSLQELKCIRIVREIIKV